MGILDAVNSVLGDELDIADHEFYRDADRPNSPDRYPWV
jgi:hypothetical protein